MSELGREFVCPECRRIVSGAYGHAATCESRAGRTAPHPDEYAAQRGTAPDSGTWESCGCLRNEAGAHRVGCPDHPEGIPGR